MTTKTDELKPCPFCGGKASFERQGTHRQSAIVVCGSCGCRHESGYEYELSAYGWNTRQPAMHADAAQIIQEAAELMQRPGKVTDARWEYMKAGARLLIGRVNDVMARRRIEGEST